MAASFTRPLRFTIRSTSRWPDTIPAPTPIRQTTWCSINPRIQMAGVGGDGGNGNAATGGSADMFSSIFDLIGSDVIATGHNSAGNGGNGHFSGSMVDINVAIYAPINIAVAGYNSTAEAHQSNNVQFDQSAIQMAGIGGDGGHGNTAFGGDFAMHLLSDLHLLDHLPRRPFRFDRIETSLQVLDSDAPYPGREVQGPLHLKTLRAALGLPVHRRREGSISGVHRSARVASALAARPHPVSKSKIVAVHIGTHSVQTTSGRLTWQRHHFLPTRSRSRHRPAATAQATVETAYNSGNISSKPEHQVQPVQQG